MTSFVTNRFSLLDLLALHCVDGLLWKTGRQARKKINESVGDIVCHYLSITCACFCNAKQEIFLNNRKVIHIRFGNISLSNLRLID